MFSLVKSSQLFFGVLSLGIPTIILILNSLVPMTMLVVICMEARNISNLASTNSLRCSKKKNCDNNSQYFILVYGYLCRHLGFCLCLGWVNFSITWPENSSTLLIVVASVLLLSDKVPTAFFRL